MPEWEDDFIGSLLKLKTRDQVAVLAELRRGLATGCPYSIYRWLPNDLKPWEERAALEVAPLFALHPDPGGSGNLGYSFSLIRDPSDSLEKRFVALLNCHRDDLPTHLRNAIGLLKAKDIAVNWRQLLKDVQTWGSADRKTQREWAKSFWGRREAIPPKAIVSAPF